MKIKFLLRKLAAPPYYYNTPWPMVIITNIKDHDFDTLYFCGVSPDQKTGFTVTNYIDYKLKKL